MSEAQERLWKFIETLEREDWTSALMAAYGPEPSYPTARAMFVRDLRCAVAALMLCEKVAERIPGSQEE